MEKYNVIFYDLYKNDFITEEILSSSFENALEYARRIQTKEQMISEIKIKQDKVRKIKRIDCPDYKAWHNGDVVNDLIIGNLTFSFMRDALPLSPECPEFWIQVYIGDYCAYHTVRRFFGDAGFKWDEHKEVGECFVQVMREVISDAQAYLEKYIYKNFFQEEQ